MTKNNYIMTPEEVTRAEKMLTITPGELQHLINLQKNYTLHRVSITYCYTNMVVTVSPETNTVIITYLRNPI